MSQRTLGITLLAVGLVVAAVGLWGMATSGGEGEVEAVASTTTTVTLETTTTTAAQTTTSTTLPPTTTSTMATTTTTVDPAVRVEEFVVEFAEAIDNGDVDLLFATLSPDVIDLFGADVCRGFIEDEILLLGDYRITGEVTPINGSATQFEAPVTFTFQGGEFDANAMFAVDGSVVWFGECR